MYGMPSGFAELLRRKYDILQQQANTGQFNAETGRLTGTADARLANVRAGLLPAESAASVDKTKADTALTQEQTKFVGPLARSSIDLNAANAFQSRSSGRLYGSQAETEDAGRKLFRTNFGIRALNEDDVIRSQLRNMVRIGLGPLGN